MLSLSDIVTLASQGYKPSDVKELISLSKEADSQTPPDQGQNIGAQGAAEPESNPSNDGKAGENPSQSNPAEQSGAGHENTTQVEDLQRQLAEANAKLAEAQKQNINKDMSGNKTQTDEQLVSDWIKSFI